MIFPGRFEGKCLVVTGAGQGLGEAVATRAAREGATVALVDRSEIVREVADKLASEGAQTLALIADLERYLGAATAMAAARNRFGRVDVLINNVGGAINFKPYVEFTEEQIAAEIRRSLFPSSRAFCWTRQVWDGTKLGRSQDNRWRIQIIRFCRRRWRNGRWHGLRSCSPAIWKLFTRSTAACLMKFGSPFQVMTKSLSP